MWVRAALHVNMAAALAVQAASGGGGSGGGGGGGALKLAEKCARAGVAACPGSAHAQRMLVYVLLRSGQTAEAIEWLKLHRASASVPS